MIEKEDKLYKQLKKINIKNLCWNFYIYLNTQK